MKSKEIKIIFMGTPSISAYVLEEMIKEGYNIIGVISQPDRPQGRKHIISATPTKEVANRYNIPCYQKEKIRLDYEFLKEIKPDLILTLAYGQILPQGLLDIPSLGCLNLHGSLLPKYRGAAPIQYALINNEKETGMSLMEMTAQMDAGRVYAVNKFPILEEDNASSLFSKMAISAYTLVKESLEDYVNGKLEGTPQDESLVTFAPTIKKEEEHLDLSKSVKTIYGYIRALSEAPGAYLNSPVGKFKIYKAKIHSYEVKGQVGMIITCDNKNGLLLQCIDGILELEVVQKEGKSKIDAKSFINGNKDFLGTILF